MARIDANVCEAVFHERILVVPQWRSSNNVCRKAAGSALGIPSVSHAGRFDNTFWLVTPRTPHLMIHVVWHIIRYSLFAIQCRSLRLRTASANAPIVRTDRMPTAPEPYLSAGLDTVRWALMCCRNWTLNDAASVRQVNDLMEAIHEVLAMLMNWRPDSLDKLRTHLGCFRFDHWRDVTGDNAVSVPDLVAWFDRQVTESENQP